MKRLVAVLLLTVGLFGMAQAENYVNPIPVYNDAGQKMDAADPFVLRFDGKYYLYTTGSAEIRVYESDDLVSWKYRGACTNRGQGQYAYAPEVFYWRGMFYMITSPMGNGHYIMRSDSPLGPFDRITDNFGFSIDGSLFAGDDGTLYMLNLTGNNSVGITEIDPETMKPKGVNKSTSVTLYRWTEGPGVFRRGDWSYITFTGNHYLSTGYRVAWASRKGDLVGRYTQNYDHTLLINSVFGDPFTGIGHSSNFYGPDLDSIYTSYHTHAPQLVGGFARWYNLDRLLTNGGCLYSTGATNFEMPVPGKAELSGYAGSEKCDFAASGQGYFAVSSGSPRFTQECNFILNGGTAAWRMGSKDGKDALIKTDGKTLSFTVGDTEVKTVPVPELGENGRIHTLRVECTEDILYVYVDTMRLLTQENPGITADTVGAVCAENVAYSFMAHTSKALGDTDYTCLKTIPGKFAAIHTADRPEFILAPENEQKAAILGACDYAVRVASDAEYAFDITYRASDMGKTIDIQMDGETILTETLPEIDIGQEFVTFTTSPVSLKKGDHTLTLASDGAAILTVSSFEYKDVREEAWNFTEGERENVIMLGGFNLRNGAADNKNGKNGFVLIGDEGYVDYEVTAEFEIPKAGSGFSGFLMHATDVSFYKDNVPESAFGYAVAVSKSGISVRRLNYGAPGDVDTVKIPEWKNAEIAKIVMRMEDGVFTVSLPDAQEPLLTIGVEGLFTHGMTGMFSTGKELRVHSLSVSPIKE